NPGSIRTLIFSAPVTTALNTADRITVTFSTTQGNRAVSVQYASGLASLSPKDVSATGTGNATTFTTSNAFTIQSEELIIAAFGQRGNEIVSSGISYIALTQVSAGTNVVLFPEYRVVSSSGSYSATASTFSARPYAGALVTYKAGVSTSTSISLTSG